MDLASSAEAIDWYHSIKTTTSSPWSRALQRRTAPTRATTRPPEHPYPRWHGLHLGAPQAPVLQAREELRDPPQRRHLPPQAARPAHRGLIVQEVEARCEHA